MNSIAAPSETGRSFRLILFARPVLATPIRERADAQRCNVRAKALVGMEFCVHQSPE